MFSRLFFCCTVACGAVLPCAAFAQKDHDATIDSLRRVYIARYCDIAMDEMERSGIPASIKLAQAILETRAGTSELAQKANNHFGIKCGKHWSGETYSKNDDEYDAKGRPVLSCFRQYANVIASYADHSAFLRHPEKQQRYGFLFDLSPLDYKGWAEGLQQAGYSPVSHYAERLIFYIERHQLYEYDRAVVSGRQAMRRSAVVNRARMVQARAGESLSDIAQLYGISVDSLVAYNDSLYRADSPLQIGDPVFIEPKAIAADEDGPWIHRSEKGQTLQQLAQRYGIRLPALRSLNPGLRRDTLDANVLVSLRPSRSEPQTALVVKGIPMRQGNAAQAPQRLPAEVSYQALVSVAQPKAPAPITIDMQTGEVEVYHTVSAGETLSSIARRYQTKVEHLQRLNPGLDKAIRVGQTLRVQ